MVGSRNRGGRRGAGTLALAVFVAGFALFTLNVLLGKAAISFGWTGIPLLGDVAEFLLLLFAVTVFVVATLLREREQNERHDSHEKSRDREQN